MKPRFFACLMIALYTMMAVIPAGVFSGCSSSSDDGGGGGGDPSSLTFTELMTQTNTKQSTLTNDLSSYIQGDQDLQTICNDDSSTNSEMLTAANNYIASGETLLSTIASYDTFISEYMSRIEPAAMTVAAAKQGAGSADPLLPTQLGSAINDCKTLVAQCEAMTDEIDKQQCLRGLTLKCPSKIARIGASAIFGSGASAITGLALGSAALSLTGIGVVVGVGILAGVFFDYCTSSSNIVVKDSEYGATCGMASNQLTLNSSGFGVTSLPQGGPGTLRIHIEGCAPVVFSGVTIGAAGLNVSVPCAPTASTDPSGAATANNDAQEGQGAEDPGGGTCSTISTLIVSPSPTDPAPDQDVAVTASAFPAADGCTVQWSISGTDGYSNSGSPTTSSGAISFTIPGGAEGVVDTVVVSTNNITQTISYTF